jgi:hypothetical protein
MAKPLTLNDLPEDLAHFAKAEMAAGRLAPSPWVQSTVA